MTTFPRLERSPRITHSISFPIYGASALGDYSEIEEHLESPSKRSKIHKQIGEKEKPSNSNQNENLFHGLIDFESPQNMEEQFVQNDNDGHEINFFNQTGGGEDKGDVSFK